jgi:hypothetical protein
MVRPSKSAPQLGTINQGCHRKSPCTDPVADPRSLATLPPKSPSQGIASPQQRATLPHLRRVPGRRPSRPSHLSPAPPSHARRLPACCHAAANLRSPLASKKRKSSPEKTQLPTTSIQWRRLSEGDFERKRSCAVPGRFYGAASYIDTLIAHP